MTASLELDALNHAGQADFATALSGVFEEADWVAERAWEVRPFPTVAALHQALFDEVADADEQLQLEFLNGHPDLAGEAAQRGTLTAHSTREQDGLGLHRRDDALALRLGAMNQAYRTRFGFPFLICVRRHTRASLLARFERRLHADPAHELQAALQEVFYITRLRLAGLVQGPGVPATAGALSTHVTDAARGRPAPGVRVELFEIDEDGAPVRLAEAATGPDGRIPALLDRAGPLPIGRYELRFHMGAYFGTPADPAFLDVIPIRIGIAEAEAQYHVPLLASPWTYTTYRGS